MVDEAGNAARGGVQNHVLLKGHEIVVLGSSQSAVLISRASYRANKTRAYLSVLVDLIHAPFALFVCDDLASVLDDDLVSFEAPVGPHTKAPVLRLHHLDAGAIRTGPFGT